MLNCSAALVTIAAVDFDRLITFYSMLLEQPPQPWQPQIYAGFRVAGVEIGIFKPQASHAATFTGGGAVCLCLEVADLNLTIDSLTKSGYPHQIEVITASHGQESYIYDPDGNRIILHQGKKAEINSLD
jgi:predicted enzyme related to lactoylglutathione lyase